MAVVSHEVLTRLKCCPCIVALETHAFASFFVISGDADSCYVGRGTFLLHGLFEQSWMSVLVCSTMSHAVSASMQNMATGHKEVVGIPIHGL